MLLFAGCKEDTIFEEGDTFVSGQINGYAYIDLGLPSGLKWVTCNIGATSHEEYGEHYAWGRDNDNERLFFKQ